MNNNPVSKKRPREQAASIEKAKSITEIIIEQEREILLNILLRRLKPETYLSIATNESASLTALGATDADLQNAVVARVCQKVIHPDISKSIYKITTANRPVRKMTTGTKQKMAKVLDGIRLYDNPEADETLQELAARDNTETNSLTREGKDWTKIAEMMQQKHKITLTALQWSNRFGRMRKKSQKNINNLSASSQSDTAIITE